MMTRRAHALSPLVIVALLACPALFLAGCLGALRQDEPPKSFYVLDAAPPPASLASPALEGSLLVREVRVAPPFNTRDLTYRLGPSSYATDYYHLFLAQPGELVTQQVRSWLGKAGLFRHVALPGSGLPHDFVLEGLVTELYGDFTDGQGKAVVAAQFFLLDERTPGRRVLLSSERRLEADLPENSPAGLVAAMNRALTGILQALAADIQALSARGEAGLPSR